MPQMPSLDPTFLFIKTDILSGYHLLFRESSHNETTSSRTCSWTCARAIGRDEVPARIKALKAKQERLFPTKYRKFGDSALVSLDEVLFEDGVTTRGDRVTRGLWD